jgi:hypothetical protein
MGVGGSGVGEGPSVGGGPTVSAITVLTSAVISIGVDSPLAGMIGAHAERNTTRIIVKAVNFFIEASLSLGLPHKTKCSHLRHYEKYDASSLIRIRSSYAHLNNSN